MRFMLSVSFTSDGKSKGQCQWMRVTGMPADILDKRYLYVKEVVQNGVLTDSQPLARPRDRVGLLAADDLQPEGGRLGAIGYGYCVRA